MLKTVLGMSWMTAVLLAGCSSGAGTTAKTTELSPILPTVTLTAAATSVSAGNTTSLTWSTTDATTCTASGAWAGSKGTSGTETTAALSVDSIFTLTCTGPGGSAAASVTVVVPAGPTVLLDASPTSIIVGGVSNLTWSSTNASSCSASDGWSGAKVTSGTAAVGPLSATTTFTLSCTGPGGQVATSVTVTVAGTTVTVTPRIAALTLSQSQQFSAAAPGAGAVTWSVDGITGGNSAVGTITSNGVYAPPASAGRHTVVATSINNSSLSGSAIAAVTDLDGVFTYHNDLARTGHNLREYALTKAEVSGSGFGKRWSCAVDGDVYAQPLYAANLVVGGVRHNVVYVATNHDSVYAFDADSGSCAPLWQVSLLGSGATTIPAGDVGSCPDVLDEYGIFGTPVIDPSSRTLYVVGASKEGGNYFQRLHALDLATGAAVHVPTVISLSAASGGSTVTFDALRHLQRAGLVLSQGGVFITWASHCDIMPYYGWMARYDAATLAHTATFNVAPNGGQGGIWMSGAAPAVDTNGSIYLSTGNGSFTNNGGTLPALPPANDFSMSFLNLEPTTLTLNDFYTPSQQAAWSAPDYDISSIGVMVLPDGAGPGGHPNLLFGGDKQGHVWMLDRALLGEYSPTGENVVQILDAVNLAATGHYIQFAPPVFYNNTVYLSVTGNPLIAVPLSGGLFPASAQNELVPSSVSSDRYSFPGGFTSISASPSGEGIIWTLDNSIYAKSNRAAGPAVLRAYDASNLGTRLFNSSASAGNTAGNAVKFTLPIVANGHVYVAGGKQLTVYGLAP